ncbi:Mismatch repair endonuclease pms2 [Linnemannia gamsii]|uniref:Mismatch repair endonuclease pms2 n=1 Tax=Linnemannia gamsii TaxID=64522 RepID=A0ABQ7JX38_9FUNG|nr:Mismatch repair endonuclease pms2 [Linnemannia gamsii]
MASENAIKAIDRESVHRICSGQVVLDMATAVKELLENSLDAGSSSIVVKFKQNGLEYITVTDNGCGITDANLETLALKHYTSKLSSFNDLANVRSFGFRGEALSSLCALAHVTVTTSTGTAPTGLLVEYNSDGAIQSKTPAPMTKGTIVKISNLFEGMPVRRSEFVKNIKREYNKCIGLVQAYALIATNVRISCVSQVDKKPAVTYIATSGNSAVRQNIINVFGPKAMTDLVDFELKLVEGKAGSSSNQKSNDGEEHEGVDSGNQDDDGQDQDIVLTGHISSPSFGKGRSSTDRQYLFINGRPCVLPKIARVINEVYHSFNTNQSPFLVANLILPTAAYDVNVSPDKRTIFLHNERRIVEELRNKLTELFEPSRSTFAVSEASQLIKKPDLAARLKSSSAVTLHDDEESQDRAGGMEGKYEGEDEYLGVVQDHSTTTPVRRPTTARIESVTLTSISSSSTVSRSPLDSAATMATKLQQTTLTDRIRLNSEAAESRKRKTREDASGSEEEDRPLFQLRAARRIDRPQTEREVTDHEKIRDDQSEERPLDQQTDGPLGSPLDVLETYDPLDDKIREEEDNVSDSEDEQAQFASRAQSTKLQRVVTLDSVVRDDGDREWIEVGFDMDDHRKKRALRMKILRETRCLEQEHAALRKEKVRARVLELQRTATTAAEAATFASEHQTEGNEEGGKGLEETRRALRGSRRLRSQKLSDASFANTDDDKAQQSLSRVITKVDFRRMKVLGQFNKAFIVVRLDNYANSEQDKDEHHETPIRPKRRRRRGTLHSSDIFVIDQHASDEKYNFETLQAKTVFSTQRLFQPKKLHLMAQEEITVVDHMKMLNMNGFYLDYNPQAQVSHRLQLVTLPVSEKVVFDLQDFEELVFLLSQQTESSYGSLGDDDDEGERVGHHHKHKLHSPQDKMVRCSKVRSLFASRACRRSVMIGHVLNHTQMKRIVRHMGEIDQPWNCPHGRPTMRHLLDLAELEVQERRARRRQQNGGGSRVDDEDDDEDESLVADMDRTGAFDPVAVKRPTRHQGSLFKQFLTAKSEYWKSNAKFFCRFCKIYITDNKSTRGIHDQGTKHKENVERFLREQNQRGRDREAESARMDKQMDAIEKAAMKQYQLDVEAGLVQPSAAMQTKQAEATSSTTKPSGKDSEPTSTGLLKVSSTPAPESESRVNDTTTDGSGKGKTETGADAEAVAATTPVKPKKDETIGQAGEWETVEAPAPKTSQQSKDNSSGGGANVDDDEEVAGNPEDLRRFKIVEKTYPVDDDDLAGEGEGSAVFKKRKGGVGKPRNIRRKL